MEGNPPATTGMLQACARCGAPFTCGVDAPGGCWCARLPPLPAGALVAGEACVCERCLRAALAGEETTNEDEEKGRR